MSTALAANPKGKKSRATEIASIFLRKHGGVYVSLRSADSSTSALHWQNVGGKVDFAVDQSLVEGAARETREETGLRISVSRFVFLAKMECISEAGQPYSVSCFVVDLLPHEVPRRIENKNTPWMLVMPDEVQYLNPSVPSLLATTMLLTR